ncbi:MAG: hypothetical protein JXR70_18040 [Spirochaetales bacterium]|nr:hypothetical protein [Spirochaetales bacterium]
MNSIQIKEFGNKSTLITEMVDVTKEGVNTTNMLSIITSIEASRTGENEKGFSFVTAKMRELSKESIASAKKADQSAFELYNFFVAIIISSESESQEKLDMGETTSTAHKKNEEIIKLVTANYSSTQKIDISRKQQERDSAEAAKTIGHMAKNSKKSAEISKQTTIAVKDIVSLEENLLKALKAFDTNSTQNHLQTPDIIIEDNV